MARQLCICLYWTKFNEDRVIYFDKVPDLRTKLNKSVTRNHHDSDEDSESESDEEEGFNQLTHFLLEYYRGLTPHIFDPKTCRILDRSTQMLSGISSDRFFGRLSYSLENIDEFVIFKKFLVT